MSERVTSLFAGRRAELAALERQARREGAAFVPVYGRRRVGKTELLVRFCAGKRAVYFAATQGTPAQQLRAFLRTAAEALGRPVLAEVDAQGWEQALRLVLGEVPAGQRLVLVLDEFQWLCEGAPELPSVLQKLWDHDWQRRKGFFLVLCGSYVGFMEREVLGKQSPLFGRRTGQLQLGPLSYLEAAELFPRWPAEDRARAWFICGGVPAYLRTFSPDRSIDQNIIDAFLEVDAPLMREAEFLLREELRDVGSYTTLVEAIAAGQATPTAMSKYSALPVPRVVYFLKTLLELGYVERRVPLVPGRASRKLVRYVLGDPLLRFWFKFVAPNFSAIRRGPAAQAFAHLIAPQLEAFYGLGFEALCREALPLLLKHERVVAPLQVGEYWAPEVQIDLVGLRGDRWTELGECKWGAPGSLAAVAEDLALRARRYPLGATTPRLRIFTRRHVAGRAPPNVAVTSLGELYKL